MATGIGRRQFISALGGAAASWPFAARAQQPAMPVVGVLGNRSGTESPHLLSAFRRGLKESDYVEGQNLTIEYRWTQGQYDRLPELAIDLVRRHVAVIFAEGPAAALATKAATSTIPLVFSSGGDVVKSGLVASLNRPGGNATGVNLFTQEVETKKLEMLTKLVPSAATIAFLINPKNPAAEGKVTEMQQAALALGRRLEVFNAATEGEVDAAFATFRQNGSKAVVVGSDPVYDNAWRERFIELAARYSVPTIYGQREYAADGGLVSYGSDLVDAYRQMGIYTGRILRGEKPADLPVVRPTRLELVINLNTAKALGLTIPPGVLAIADEVIE